MRLEDLSDEALAEAWLEVQRNFTGTLREAGFPNPNQVPYEPTGSPATLATVRAAYYRPDTGYRKRFLELWDATQGRLPYVNEELKLRIQQADSTEEMWALVGDFTGRVIEPLSGTPPEKTGSTTTEPAVKE